MTSTHFRIWGCRGGRNTQGSRVGNHTSCYALRAGADLFVFDAGRGLLALADAVLADAARGIPASAEAPLAGIARVHVLVTHAHLDHWEGLKDAAWMWTAGNGLALTLRGPAEALAAIRQAHAPPSFVPLEVLAMGTLARFEVVELTAGAQLAVPGATLRTVALHHYSGMDPHRRHLDTLGYHLAIDGGPRVAYLCDHEPTEASRAREDDLVGTADLAIVDANYGVIAEHAFGHGSVEYAAALAARHPAAWVLASHHGPMRSDAAIEAAARQHGAAQANLALGVEGLTATWDAAQRRFV